MAGAAYIAGIRAILLLHNAAAAAITCTTREEGFLCYYLDHQGEPRRFIWLVCFSFDAAYSGYKFQLVIFGNPELFM